MFHCETRDRCNSFSHRMSETAPSRCSQAGPSSWVDPWLSEVNPMPGPVLSFWKVPVSLALTQNPKKKNKNQNKNKTKWQERGPSLGRGQGEDLGCSPVLSTLILRDERANASSALAGSGQGTVDRDICSLAAEVENCPRKENHGSRKIKTVSQCCG